MRERERANSDATYFDGSQGLTVVMTLVYEADWLHPKIGK